MNPEAPFVVVELPHKTRPLMLDNVPAPSDPDAGPFLISSSRGLMWVERAFGGGFLRVAIRRVEPHDLFRSVVREVSREGNNRGWGNTFPATASGVDSAFAHVDYYELPNPMLLHGATWTEIPEGRLSRRVEWMPEGWAIVLPDREYVGTVFTLGDGHVGLLCHNPSRGMAILRPGGGQDVSSGA